MCGPGRKTSEAMNNLFSPSPVFSKNHALSRHICIYFFLLLLLLLPDIQYNALTLGRHAVKARHEKTQVNTHSLTARRYIGLFFTSPLWNKLKKEPRTHMKGRGSNSGVKPTRVSLMVESQDGYVWCVRHLQHLLEARLSHFTFCTLGVV